MCNCRCSRNIIKQPFSNQSLRVLKKHTVQVHSIILFSTYWQGFRTDKEKTGKTASTIHSFLANQNSTGLINENFTFKRKGGKVDGSINHWWMQLLSSSPPLLKINWNKSFILVGDLTSCHQLVRVESILCYWMDEKKSSNDNLGKLDINVRQLSGGQRRW